MRLPQCERIRVFRGAWAVTGEPWRASTDGKQGAVGLACAGLSPDGQFTGEVSSRAMDRPPEQCGVPAERQAKPNAAHPWHDPAWREGSR